jgi:hypothetical protein
MKKIFLAVLILFSINVNAGPSWYPIPSEAYLLNNIYPQAQRLLFAFDYGHGLVYEKLLNQRGKITNPEKFEKILLKTIIDILKNPPQVKMEEDDIAPNYVFAFPLTVNLFDWSHLLHQYVLDIMASSEDRGEKMYTRIDELFKHYKKNDIIAITDVCKTMLFMDGHIFSKKFRRTYPSFNLLIWSYHWFQIRLYEDLMLPTKKERDLAIDKTIKEFWTLISDLPDSAEFDMMPETFKIAPTFSKKFPLIAASFDNNHMLHDIVSDLLSSDTIPYEVMKKEGIRIGRMALDPEAFRSNNCINNTNRE